MPIHSSPFDNPTSPEWTQSTHVIWSTRRLAYLDDLLLSSPNLNYAALEKMQTEDIMTFPAVRPLTPENAVPEVFDGLFGEMSRVLLGNEEEGGVWRLNKEMRDIVREANEWQKARSVDSRGERRKLIVAHVRCVPLAFASNHFVCCSVAKSLLPPCRLGDKSLELANYGPAVFPRPSSSSSDLLKAWQIHQHSAKALTASLRHSSSSKDASPISPPEISDETVEAYMTACVGAAERAGVDFAKENGRKPVLLIMSDDSTGKGLEKFRKHQKMEMFELLTGVGGGPSTGILEEGQKSKRLSIGDGSHIFSSGFIEPSADLLPSKHQSQRRISRRSPHSRRSSSSSSPNSSTNATLPNPAAGFTESIFNSLLPSSRISLTRSFLRDLTLLASSADGLVFTGSSNVGRLWLLLADHKQSEIKRREERRRSPRSELTMVCEPRAGV